MLVSKEFSHGDSVATQLFDAFICGRLYWFIYAILMTYALSPLFWKLKAWNIPLVVLIFAVNIILGLANIELPDILQFKGTLANIGYFILGYIFQLYHDTVSQWAKKLHIPLLVASFAICAWIVYFRLVFWNEMPYWGEMLAACSQLYIFYSFAKILPAKLSVLTFLGAHSLQIMFFDSFFKVILTAILKPSNILMLAVVIIVNMALTSGLCIVIKKIPYVRVLVGL